MTTALPMTAKTLEGQAVLWPEGIELVFAGTGAHADKKKVSPTRVRLTDLDQVELTMPQGLRRGVLRLHLRQPVASRPDKAAKDPLSTMFAVGTQQEGVIALGHLLSERGVRVVGLPTAVVLPQEPPPPPPTTPPSASPAQPSAPPVAPAQRPAPIYVAGPVVGRRYDTVMKWQVRFLGFQLFLYLLGFAVFLAVVLFVVISIARG